MAVDNTKITNIAFTDDGLSIIASKIGNPIMLDSYTCTMCNESWGRSSFARAMIEVQAEVELKESVVIVVPNLNGEGYTCETIKAVKELPIKQVERDLDGFQVVKKRNFERKRNDKSFVVNTKKQMKYVPVSKPIEARSSKENVASSSKQHGKLTIGTSNPFSVLQDEENEDLNSTDWQKVGSSRYVELEPTKEDTEEVDSDDDVENVFDETTGFMQNDGSKGESTPVKKKRYVQKSVRSGCGPQMYHIAGRVQELFSGEMMTKNVEITDVNSTGLHYTWNQKSKCDYGILKKMDRVMANLRFTSEFPSSYVVFQLYRISDHASAVLKIQKISSDKPKPFKFFNFLSYKPEFLQVVTNQWGIYVNGHNMFRLVKRLRASSSLRDEEAVYLDAFNQATLDEERYLKQKAKIEWLRVGDTNSGYFHRSVKANVSRSRSEDTVAPLDEDGLFTHNLNSDKALFMVRQVTNEEIKDAIFNIGNDKAPGPDGFTSIFFKKAWDIVGNDVCNAVKDFLSNGQILREINHTIIALLPKVSTPSKINDYRLISCCNVIYKCISKIITNRIKNGLDDVVSLNQSAFILGRSISDNILLTQELMHNYHLNRGHPRCAFKIDIQKAYDTVSWKFLNNILMGFGFHKTMIKWIMACVSSTSYSINVNGELHGYFQGKEDDLIMFSRGDIQSAKILMKALEEFKCASGLVPKRVQKRIGDWKNKWLSFAGRLQLCLSVISSMHVYWASVFILSVGIINDIEQLMCGFLCCQGELQRGKVKVAWKDVCLPKVEGGLGIRKLERFNIALMSSYIWKILTSKESLWVRWIHSYKVRRRSFWDVPLGSNVTNLILDNAWSWPDEWSTRYPTLATINVPILHEHAVVLRWKDVNGNLRPFSVRLKTQDRLRPWDIGGDVDLSSLRCPLCKVEQDSLDHLFFACNFSSQVWNIVVNKAHLPIGSHLLSDIMGWILPTARKNNVICIVGRLIIVASSYYIWQERNNRLYVNGSRSVEQLASVILDLVRLKLGTIKFKRNARVAKLKTTWNLPAD
ncbi:hypothetical protein Tco_0936047 [Tanacetum coccineum]